MAWRRLPEPLSDVLLTTMVFPINKGMDVRGRAVVVGVVWATGVCVEAGLGVTMMAGWAWAVADCTKAEAAVIFAVGSCAGDWNEVSGDGYDRQLLTTEARKTTRIN